VLSNTKEKMKMHNQCSRTPSKTKKTSHFISLSILRNLPQQKIPRELCCGEIPAIFLHSDVSMERVFDGMEQKNSKTDRSVFLYKRHASHH